MDHDEPIAFFITWTVYGTFLQGDARGWRKRKRGSQTPQPKLNVWRADRLKYSIELLGSDQREAVEIEIDRLANFRGWHLWASNARVNHVHVIVTASGFSGAKVRDQLKANCTRILREKWSKFVARPVWTTGGDWQCVNTEGELEQVVFYVSEGQDRKGVEDGHVD